MLAFDFNYNYYFLSSLGIQLVIIIGVIYVFCTKSIYFGVISSIKTNVKPYTLTKIECSIRLNASKTFTYETEGYKYAIGEKLTFIKPREKPILLAWKSKYNVIVIPTIIFFLVLFLSFIIFHFCGILNIYHNDHFIKFPFLFSSILIFFGAYQEYEKMDNLLRNFREAEGEVIDQVMLGSRDMPFDHMSKIKFRTCENEDIIVFLVDYERENYDSDVLIIYNCDFPELAEFKGASQFSHSWLFFLASIVFALVFLFGPI